MARNDKARKKRRKVRNQYAREHLLDNQGPARNRWQGSMALRFGRHPDAVWHVQWSGIKVAVDDFATMDLEAVVALTELALQPPGIEPS